MKKIPCFFLIPLALSIASSEQLRAETGPLVAPPPTTPNTSVPPTSPGTRISPCQKNFDSKIFNTTPFPIDPPLDPNTMTMAEFQACCASDDKALQEAQIKTFCPPVPIVNCAPGYLGPFCVESPTAHNAGATNGICCPARQVLADGSVALFAGASCDPNNSPNHFQCTTSAELNTNIPTVQQKTLKTCTNLLAQPLTRESPAADSSSPLAAVDPSAPRGDQCLDCCRSAFRSNIASTGVPLDAVTQGALIKGACLSMCLAASYQNHQ